MRTFAGFATSSSIRSRGGEAISMVRSVRRGELLRSVWTGRDAFVRLWWGAIEQVSAGDSLVFFHTPLGMAIEAVERVEPTPHEPLPAPYAEGA